MDRTTKQTRAEVLQEAMLLEQMGAEWTVRHAAAFCCVSESFINRSDCPRVEKDGVSGVKGKAMIRYLPATVRTWNAGRTKRVNQSK